MKSRFFFKNKMLSILVFSILISIITSTVSSAYQDLIEFTSSNGRKIYTKPEVSLNRSAEIFALTQMLLMCSTKGQNELENNYSNSQYGEQNIYSNTEDLSRFVLESSNQYIHSSWIHRRIRNHQDKEGLGFDGKIKCSDNGGALASILLEEINKDLPRSEKIKLVDFYCGIGSNSGLLLARDIGGSPNDTNIKHRFSAENCRKVLTGGGGGNYRFVPNRPSDIVNHLKNLYSKWESRPSQDFKTENSKHLKLNMTWSDIPAIFVYPITRKDFDAACVNRQDIRHLARFSPMSVIEASKGESKLAEQKQWNQPGYYINFPRYQKGKVFNNEKLYLIDNSLDVISPRSVINDAIVQSRGVGVYPYPSKEEQYCDDIAKELEGDSGIGAFKTNYIGEIISLSKKICDDNKKRILDPALSKIDKAIKDFEHRKIEVENEINAIASGNIPEAKTKYLSQIIEALDKLKQQKKDIQSLASYNEDTSSGDITCTSPEITINIPSVSDPSKVDQTKINISSPILDSSSDPIDESISPQSNNSPDTSQAGSDPYTACYSGSGVLGWFVCPVVKLVDGAFGGLYSWVRDNFIRVEHNIFQSDSKNPVYEAWDTIRNIANILFIILLLVVIFSQVTGIGIDNYGIKKILPKIIVSAILINLSFVIYTIFVDLSNILGYSIQEFFSGISKSPTNSGASLGQGIVGFLLGAGGTSIAAIAIFNNPAILVSLFVSVLAGFASVLILWLILVARQAAIILLAVISPLAFAAYMLPNTKKLFDKWLSITKTMLIMFPICSLIFGASQLAGKVLAPAGSGSGNEYLAMAAMLIQVVPYFVIPSLIKNSMNALNGLGSRLSGLAGKAYSRPNSAYARSDFKRNLDIKSKAYDPTGLKAKFANSKFANSRIGKSLGIQERRAGQLHAYNKKLEEEGMSAYLVDPERQAEELKRINSRIEAKQVDDEISSMADSTGQYNTEIMQKQLSGLLNKGGKIEGRDAIRAKALMKKLATSSGFDKKQLTSMISGITSNDGREFIARYAQKNSDVGAAISQKSGATGQYLRDVASGYADNRYKDMGLTEWLSDSAPGRNGQSNESFVANTVLSDDSDFLRQSSGEVARNLALVDNNRIQNMINNRALMESITDKDIKKHIVDAANQRGLKSDYIGSDVKTIIIPK